MLINDSVGGINVVRCSVFGQKSNVQQTQSIAGLRVHVERCIRRVKENKLFDKPIPLSVCCRIDQLFSVACFLVNYQNGPLVKSWSVKC